MQHKPSPPAKSAAATSMAPTDRIALIQSHLDALHKQSTISISPVGSRNFARSIMRARALRAKHFPASFFSDPAWDILLELYALHCEGQRTMVSKLCLGAGVPATTVIRWIEKLCTDGFILRQEDQFDRRRVWVSISPAGFETMTRYLQQVSGESLHFQSDSPFVTSARRA